jgi:hypothetical protein
MANLGRSSQASPNSLLDLGKTKDLSVEAKMNSFIFFRLFAPIECIFIGDARYLFMFLTE